MRALLILVPLALSLPSFAETWVIQGGTIHPVSRPSIADGVVVIRDGLIAAPCPPG